MNGADVRRAREALSWKRPELADKTGLSVAQIASIETGRSIRPNEETVLRDVLAGGLATAPVGNGKVPSQPKHLSECAMDITGFCTCKDASPEGPFGTEDEAPEPMAPDSSAPDFDPGIIVEEEWAGLKRGDVVKIKDDVKQQRTYKFLRHVKKPEQEYIELGPVKGASGRILDMGKTLLIKRKNQWVEVKP